MIEKGIATEDYPMPMITVHFAAARRAEGKQAAIAAAISRLASEILHKDPKAAAALVQEAAPGDWFCGGRSLAQAGLATFWLDIRITEGTNTKDEKAAFVAAAFRVMGEILGPLHEESYVQVHEARADSYGFGGLTQERRYIAGKLGTSLPSAA
jgi:4-oxalocrotonate tautomerase